MRAAGLRHHARRQHVQPCSMVGRRILCALDAVELLDKQAVRAANGDNIGCCPRVRVVEFLGMAEPSVGRMELGKPSEKRAVEW